MLSVLSNYASNQIGTAGELQARLTRAVTAALQNPVYTEQIGNWAVVWGPALVCAPLAIQATNAMFAAQNLDSGDIVVAMAGTNPGSLFDAAIEDLGVGDTVDFAGAPGAWISYGTSSGIGLLEAMTDPDTGLTLIDFLNALPATNANLVFTGPSLGGALSPALARCRSCGRRCRCCSRWGWARASLSMPGASSGSDCHPEPRRRRGTPCSFGP